MVNWNDQDPGLGDMGPVAVIATQQARDSEAASGIVSVLDGALKAVPSFWRGAGADSWTLTAVRQRTDLTVLMNAGEKVSQAARTYATAVADIERLAQVQIVALGAARLVVDQTFLDSPQSPPSDDVVQRRERDHADAVSVAARASHALADLAQQRQKADDAFVSALHSSVPITWPAERTAFSTLGITHPERLSAREIDSRVDDFCRELANDTGDFTVAEATTLLMLAERGEIPPGQLASLLKQHEGLASALSGVDPYVVAAWWRGMDQPQTRGALKTNASPAQQQLISSIPRALGNLDGVAYWARDAANRTVLDEDLAATETEIADMKRRGMPLMSPAMESHQRLYFERLEKLTERRDSYKNIKRSLTRALDDSPQRQLVTLTRDEPPLAAVCLGNLDQARNVTYMIPGMNSSTREITNWARAAEQVYTQQAVSSMSTNLAVVAWVGYKSPATPSIGNPDFGVVLGERARVGADKLAKDLAGLNTTRRGTTMNLNVIAHSYGTTVASLALAKHELHVKSFVSVASAGIEPSIRNAQAIHAKKVFAEQARDVIPLIQAGQGDEWAAVGRLLSRRRNPMDADFGAQRFSSAGVPDEPTMHGVTGHDQLIHDPRNPDSGYGYFDLNTESLTNIANATTGLESEVTPFSDPPLPPELQAFIDSYLRSAYSADEK